MKRRMVAIIGLVGLVGFVIFASDLVRFIRQNSANNIHAPQTPTPILIAKQKELAPVRYLDALKGKTWVPFTIMAKDDTWKPESGIVYKNTGDHLTISYDKENGEKERDEVASSRGYKDCTIVLHNNPSYGYTLYKIETVRAYAKEGLLIYFFISELKY